MENKDYKLTFLPIFEEDLNKIVDYITNELNNPEAAHKLVNDVEQAILERLYAPASFAIFSSKKKREHPYYRIYVRNFSIFYVVIDDTMEVRRILYSKRDIYNIL